jgi:urease gamma subunit
MDDFNVSSLHESKNEWGSRLVTILTPHIMEGLKSIFEEAVKLCKENGENDKYLMTFQNFITRIPKWNPVIIEKERTRIIEKSSCLYLEDLITCVHIIQLKILTAIRVGQKQKKIDINIPKIDDFIHKIYIHVARKIYKNVYLFELNIPPLQVQKNYRELEIIIQECILNTVRDSIPVEAILKAYMDETVEDDVVEEVKEQIIEPVQGKKPTETQFVKEHVDKKEEKEEPANLTLESEPLSENVVVKTETLEFPGLKKDDSHLTFNNVDFAVDENNNEEQIDAPKDVNRLEEISQIRNAQRKLVEDEEDSESSGVKLRIFDDSADLDNMDIHVIDPPNLSLNADYLLDDVEILE